VKKAVNKKTVAKKGGSKKTAAKRPVTQKPDTKSAVTMPDAHHVGGAEANQGIETEIDQNSSSPLSPYIPSKP
jgi:hypothetical protein